MTLETTKLKNGLTLFVDRVSGADGNNVAVHVPWGSANERRGEEGSAHALEHSLYVATDEFPDRSAVQLYADAHGMEINATTSQTQTLYWANGEELEPSMIHLSQILQHPTFPRRGIEAEMKALRREAMMDMDDIDTLHYIAAQNAMFGVPYGRSVAGHKSRMRFGKDRLQRIHREQYHLGKMALAVVGSATIDEVADMAEVFFAPDDQTSGAGDGCVRPEIQYGEQYLTGFVRKESPNVRVRMSYPLMPEFTDISDEESFAYTAAISLMGDLAFRALRYEAAISYDGGLDIDRGAHPDARSMYGEVTVDSENVTQAMAMLGMVFCLDSSRYSDESIAGSLEYYVRDARRMMATLDNRMEAITDRLSEYREPEDFRRIVKKVSRVGVSDVRDAIDALVEYANETPCYTHLTGARDAIGDVDRIIELDEIA